MSAENGLMVRGQQWGGRGSFSPRTATQSGSERVAFGDAPYFDAVHSREVYWASNQAAVAYSVALATTYTGLVVSNPAGSSVDLVMLGLGFVLTVAPAGIASIGCIVGYSNNGITTHTTPNTPRATYVRTDVATGQAKADDAATLVGTPYWGPHLMGGFTAAALPSTTPQFIHLQGLYIIPPGGYFAIGALTAVTGMGTLVWHEVPNDTL